MDSEDFHGLEFVIDKSRCTIAETARGRISDLFNVRVEFKDVFGGSTNYKQWIYVTGREEDAYKAKEYILALTTPAETVCMRNIWDHPLFTPEVEDEIERASCAALSRSQDDYGLVISGTELSVMLAQSMIEDILSRTIDDFTDMQNGGCTVLDPSADACIMDVEDGESSLKEYNRNEMRVGVSMDKNNSSLASLGSQSSVSTMTAAYNVNGIGSDARSSAHQLSKAALYTPFSPSGTDVFRACFSNKKTFVDCDRSQDSSREGQGKPSLNVQKNVRIFSEQCLTPRRLYPHELIQNSMYASASAIHPTTSNSQVCGSVAPRVNLVQGAQCVFPMANHAGDGVASSHCRDSTGGLQHNKQIGFSELPMEVCDSLSRLGTDNLSPQKDQQSYLRNLGHSLHYANEVIEKGLAQYSMDDVIRPVEFLDTLKRIKAHQHGGSQHSVTENPATSQISLATSRNVADTISKPSLELPVDDYSNLDESVICMGSIHDDSSTIVVSSEDEDDEVELTVSKLPAPARHPLPTHKPLPVHHYPAQPPPEHHPATRREQTAPSIREMTANRDSVVVGENSATSQRLTGQRKLRYIVIDGSNVAMAHGNNKVFSVEGLRICINYFVNRGHDRITAFVPEWRRYSENQTSITGRALLEKLHDDGFIKFTPARRINGRTIASYDDRFVLNLAEKEDGIVVSNDQFRDLCRERASYNHVVENRLLQFMFVGNHFMPPDDPLGRHGPHLDEFLRLPHQPQKPAHNGRSENPAFCEKLIVNLHQSGQRQVRKDFDQNSQPVRSATSTLELFEKLRQVFPEPSQAPKIRTILNNHKSETDINRLTNYCINILST